MLKKLRHRFLRIAMFALCTIVSVQLFSVNTINILQRDTEVRKMLNMISDNGGIFPNNFFKSVIGSSSENKLLIFV